MLAEFVALAGGCKYRGLEIIRVALKKFLSEAACKKFFGVLQLFWGGIYN